MRGAVEGQLGRRAIPEESIHVGCRVKRRVFVVRQREEDVDVSVPVVGATDDVGVVSRVAACDTPVRDGTGGHEGVHVGINGAADDPFIGRQTLGDDERVEGCQDGID